MTKKFQIKVEDIEFSFKGFYVEKIKKLSDSKLSKLEDDLSAIGKVPLYANIDDMEYLCVSWVGSDGCYKKSERDSICKVINKIL